MRNEYIKFCDENGITDGVLRHFLTIENRKESRKTIGEAIKHRKIEIKALIKLETMLQEDGYAESK